MWIFGFVTFFAAFQLFPTIPFRVIDLGGSKAAGGWFLAVYTYSCAFAAPLTGTLADRFGRKRLLVVASILFIFFSLVYAVTSNFALMLLVGALHGSVWSMLLASSAAIMTDFIPLSRRTEGLAYWGLASTSAIAIAPAAGLWMYRFGWVALCVGMAVISCGMVVLALRVPHEHQSSDHAGAPLIDLRVVAVALTLFVVSFGYGGVTSYVAILSEERGISPRSLFFSVFAIAIIVFRVLTGRLADVLGPKAVLFPSLLSVPVALLLLAWSDSRSELILAAIIYGIGFGGAYPGFVTWVLTHTAPARRGGTFGSILWAFDTGIGTGSLVTGLIAARAGLGWAFTTAAFLSCLSIPIFYATAPLLARRTQQSC